MANLLVSVSSDNRSSNENTDAFTVNFSSPIPVYGNWALALESASIWYSYYNISSDYNNNTFRYYNSSTWKIITIPSGQYTIDDINTAIHVGMKTNGDYTVVSGVDTFDITILPDYNTFKLQINVSNGYRVDLTVGTIYQLFGFEPIIVTTSQQGKNNVNISNGIDRILIHVDCVTGSFSGTNASDVIYSFTPDGAPSSLLQIRPYRLIYLPINRSPHLYSLRIYLTDQQNRRLNLNGETASYTFVLKKL
jgi:hypothetical protein